MSYFRSVYILDKDGNPFGPDQTLEGNLSKLNVSDMEVERLLVDILKELKMMNLHLSSITGEHINKTEVE